MNGKKSSKFQLLVLMLAGGFLWPSVASAGDISQVIKAVDDEYSAAQMDEATHEDLVTTLERARSSKFASDEVQYAEIVEAFRVMLSVYTETRVTAEAAARIFDASTNL